MYHIRMQMLLMGSITGSVNFGHLVKVVCANFIHFKFIILSFVINKYLVGRYFETM